MRRYVGTLMMALLPATMAAGQLLDNANNNAGDAPAAAQAGDEGGPGPRGLFGPPNAMFSAIDADGDGVISTRELRRAAVQLKKLDADKDGNITLAEVSPRGGPGGDPAQFVDRIMQNDKNADGMLSADEIPEDVKPMLDGADQNRDGVIDRAEVTTAMENMRNRFPGGPGAGWRGGPGGRPGGFNQAFDPAQMTGRLMQNDLNGDGRLTQDEVPPQAMGMLQGGDQNGDGAIDAVELQAVMRRMGERARAFGPGAGNERNGPRAPGRNGRGRERPRDQN